MQEKTIPLKGQTKKTWDSGNKSSNNGGPPKKVLD